MSPTQITIATTKTEAPETGFNMERSGSESNPRLGRTLHRGYEVPITARHTNDPFAAEHVNVLLHPEADDSKGIKEAKLNDVLHSIPEATALSSSIVSPIPISSPLTVPRNPSRARETEMPNKNVNNTTPKGEKLTGKSKRKKKKAQNKTADPAMQTIRGFAPTPVISGDEDSDFSPTRFQRRDISLTGSLASSPFIRPVSRASSITAGISALRQQLDTLELEPIPSLAGQLRNQSKGRPKSSGAWSMTSRSSGGETDRQEMTSYEVPLDQDFVCEEIEDGENDPLSPKMLLDDVHRRMTASDFDTLTCLGKGTFGTVHLVKQVATGKLFAQKMFRKASLNVQKTLIEQTKTERAILESINRHPFIVNLYYAFQDQEKLYLILEYAQGGELFTHLATERMFPEDTASFYMAELVVALNYLHETGIVYRDLKPENCLLNADGHLLLTDFGLSKVAVEGADVCNSILGTYECMAPEVIQGRPYDKTVDWWSFGALGYDLLTGGPPFTANNHQKLQEKILKNKITMPYFLGPDAKDLLTRFLRKEPRKRLGSSMPKDLQVIKSHRFFRKINWKKLENRELEPPIKPLITDPELAENFSSDFTNLALSPKTEHYGALPWDRNEDQPDPFGGFSYVASKSLFTSQGFLTAAMMEDETMDVMLG
jgi:serine/threonine-protein kinase Psk1